MKNYSKNRREKLKAAKLEAEKLEAQKLEAGKLEAERQAAERAEAERVEAERAERQAAERAEAIRLQVEENRNRPDYNPDDTDDLYDVSDQGKKVKIFYLEYTNQSSYTLLFNSVIKKYFIVLFFFFTQIIFSKALLFLYNKLNKHNKLSYIKNLYQNRQYIFNIYKCLLVR